MYLRLRTGRSCSDIFGRTALMLPPPLLFKQVFIVLRGDLTYFNRLYFTSRTVRINRNIEVLYLYPKLRAAQSCSDPWTDYSHSPIETRGSSIKDGSSLLRLSVNKCFTFRTVRINRKIQKGLHFFYLRLWYDSHSLIRTTGRYRRIGTLRLKLLDRNILGVLMYKDNQY